MKILLDTHVILWALTNDHRLSAEAREMIVSASNSICYSTVSLWEIAVKNQKAPEKCPYHERDINHFCEMAGFEPLPVLPEHVMGMRDLRIREGHYSGNLDPFDRMLISQAKTENCILISHDMNFQHYDEPCVHLI